MGQAVVQKTSPSGTIQNRSALRVCNLAGISAAKERIVRLKELRTGMTVALKDLEAQKKRDEMLANATLVLRFTKASCDAFIGLAAEFTTLMLPGAEKGAKVVKAAYGIANAGTEAAATSFAGGKIDLVKTGAAMTKAATDLIPDKGSKYLVKNQAIKAELFKAAMDGDLKSLKKSAFEYGYELGRFTLDVLETEKTKAFTGIAKQAFEYNDKIASAFDELLASRSDSIDRYFNSRINLIVQSRKLMKTIRELEEFLETCQEILHSAPKPALAGALR